VDSGMVIRFPLVLVAGCFAMLSSCSFVRKPEVNQPQVLATAKSVYVVRDNPSNEAGAFIESAIAQRGLQVTSGPMATKRKEADLYVEYVDSWAWDITMYLKSLRVTVRDNKNGTLVASGRFHQGFPHSFPNAAVKSKEVVDKIFTPGS